MIEYGNTLFEDFDLSGYDTTEYKPYLHYFDTNSEFEDEYFGDEYYEPWVSFTSGDTLVHYNKKFNGYLRFEMLTNGTIKWKSSDTAITRTIEYSKNGGGWSEITSTTAGTGINVSAGDVVCFRGENQQYAEVIDSSAEDKYAAGNIRTVSFNGTTGNFNIAGNIMSLIKKDYDEFIHITRLSGDCNFYGMFRIGNNVKSVEDLFLPATYITNGCYGYMFTSAGITRAMGLPAKHMKESCYRNMFADCASLTSVPALSNTDVAKHCFAAMFARCSSLQTVPNNYLTVLNLENADDCYGSMFKGCTALTSTPNLPAIGLSNLCYDNMFNGCTSLTSSPELPATILCETCYHCMFEGCSSLVAAPSLPAETLAYKCYARMFQNCTSLITAPELPSINLAVECYYRMFYGCSSLTESPLLPAELTSEGCYLEMFSGCTNLNKITCLALTNPSGNWPFSNWVPGVASTGTFIKHPQATWWGRGVNGIPANWTVVDYAG